MEMPAGQIAKAVNSLNQGEIIAYPTEAVWGLGCDPFNEKALNKLLSLKKRDQGKGLILVSSSLEHCKKLLEGLPDEYFKKLQNSTKQNVSNDRATTWLIPANDAVPLGVKGTHKNFALRISKHPTVVSLCDCFQLPIVSTSANLAGKKPATTINEVKFFFGKAISDYVDGELGAQKAPSEIKNLITDEVLR